MKLRHAAVLSFIAALAFALGDRVAGATNVGSNPNGPATFTGNKTFSGNVTVTGTTTTNGPLNANGAVTVATSLTATSLTVAGTTTTNGPTNMNGAVTVATSLTATSLTVTATSTLATVNVSGTTTDTGPLVCNNSITMGTGAPITLSTGTLTATGGSCASCATISNQATIINGGAGGTCATLPNPLSNGQNLWIANTSGSSKQLCPGGGVSINGNSSMTVATGTGVICTENFSGTNQYSCGAIALYDSNNNPAFPVLDVNGALTVTGAATFAGSTSIDSSGNVIVGGAIRPSGAVVQFTGGSQGAVSITTDIVYVGGSSTNNGTATLPACTNYRVIRIIVDSNGSGNTYALYPASGDKFNSASTNASVTLPMTAGGSTDWGVVEAICAQPGSPGVWDLAAMPVLKTGTGSSQNYTIMGAGTISAHFGFSSGVTSDTSFGVPSTPTVKISSTGLQTAAGAVTASTTHTQAGAFLLTKEFSNVNSANANDTVALQPPTTIGKHMYVKNSSGNSISAYPSVTSGQSYQICVDGQACTNVDTLVTLTTTNSLDCRVEIANIWDCHP